MSTPKRDQLPPSFVTKKSHIISSISTPADSYSDKSPKGSIDTPIIDLINEINAIDGLVTTSSCSGRVAVFVEGPKQPLQPHADNEHATTSQTNVDADADDAEYLPGTGGPAGKGGGHWLYVSHDPVPIPPAPPPGFFTSLCKLTRHGSELDSFSVAPRLVKLTFSPLILHVLCARLRDAKPLLAASINAGFRESGVQSLRALDDAGAGTMVGIRTMGVGFETVVGVVGTTERGEDEYRAVVSEEFLAMVFGVVNERFGWNGMRRERLRAEITRCCTTDGDGVGWEDKESRRARMREEGLRRQRQETGMRTPAEVDESRRAVEDLTDDILGFQEESLH